MKKNVQISSEEQRIQRLRTYNLLGLGKDPDFDIFTESATLIAGCPVALIAIMEEDTQRIQSCIGLELDTVARRDTVCQYTMLSREALVIEDTQLDERTSTNQIINDGGIRFYAGVPVLDEKEFVLGTLCVVDYKPNILTQSQIRSLHLLAKAVSQLYMSKKKEVESGYFTDIFYMTQNMICVLDPNFRIKQSNPVFDNAFKIQNSDHLNQSFEEFIGDDYEKVKFALALSKKEDQSDVMTEIVSGQGLKLVIQWNFKYDSKFDEIFAFGRDITKETEERLQLETSERKFRNFFENSIGLMSMHDLNGRILKVNRKGREMLQYEENEVDQLNLRDLIPEKNQGLFDEYLETLSRDGESTGAMTLKAKNGEIHYFLYQNIVEVDSDGKSYVVSTAINMTERRKLEIDLLQMKQILEQTNKVAQVGGWQIDIEGMSLYLSSHAKDIYGVNVKLQLDLEGSLAYFDKKSEPKLRAAFNRAITEGESFDLELKLQRNKIEEQVIWVRVKGVPEFNNGTCVRVFGIIQDIDQSKRLYLELERKEAMLQSFVRYVPASVSMFDHNFNYVLGSKRWRDEFKLKNHRGDKNLFTLFPFMPDTLKEIYLKALEGQAYKNTDELMTMSEADGPQHFNWEVRPWYLVNGTIGGIIIFAQNITEYIFINEELKAAKLLADSGSRAKSEFLANMSHEIRTPLNGVIGFSDLLLRTPLNEVQQQYLKYINESGTSLLSIINDILDFSKIESGKLELFIEKSNLYELTNQVVNVILFQAQRKNLELLMNIHQGIPSSIWVDESRLKQVLINMMGNAVKFTEEGEIELKVELLQKTTDKITLRFSVRDTGIGIALERQERIFQAFTQEDSSVSKRYGGTGLGLTISNNLLNYMNSKLELRSELHVGTVFYFDLVVDYEDENSFDPVDWSISRALVVDDNASNRMILSHMLQYKNIDTVLAKNGLEALQLLMDGEKFDLILMDYHMPIFSGIETIEKIKALFLERGFHIPLVILHTSSEEQEVLSQIHQEKAVVNLLKPIRSSELYKAIQKSIQEAYLENKSVVQKNDVLTEDTSKIEESLFVLVADDNEVNMALNIRILQDLIPNSTIIQAKDGLEAVNCCKKQQFDIILMDVQMPNLDGLEVTRQIRQLEGYLNKPIIGITAGNIKGEKERCLEAGMSDFLTKPIRYKDLQDALLRGLKTTTVYQDDIVCPQQHSYEDLDVTILQEHFGEDESFKNYFLNLIVEEMEAAKSNLENYSVNLDRSNLLQVLHKLKGTSYTVGMKKLGFIVGTFEENLVNGLETAPDLSVVLRELDTVLSLVNKLIDKK